MQYQEYDEAFSIRQYSIVKRKAGFVTFAYFANVFCFFGWFLQLSEFSSTGTFQFTWISKHFVRSW